MPVSNSPTTIRRSLDALLADKQMTSEEVTTLLGQIREGGVSKAEVNEVVEALSQVLGQTGDGLDVSTPDRKEVINQLMGALESEAGGSALGVPAGETGFVERLQERGTQQPTTASTQSFGGQDVSLGDDGSLSVGGRRPVMDLSAPGDTLLSALWALGRPGMLKDTNEELAPEAKTKLADTLLTQLDKALGVSDEEPGKFRRHQAMGAALSALANNKESLSAEQSEKLVELLPKFSTPLQKMMVKRAVGDGEKLSEESKQALADFKFPEYGDEVLAAFDSMVKEESKAGWTTIKGRGAQFGLGAIVFAKNQAGVDNILGGMKEWDALNPGWNQHWVGEELDRMGEEFESYIERYPQVVYVFGTFSKNAPKLVAGINSEKAVNAVIGELDAAEPNLKGFKLSGEQAAFVKSILPSVRDTASVDEMVKCLEESRSMLPTGADGVMSPASFEIFRKMALPYQDQIEGSKDGKLGYNDLRNDLRKEAGELKGLLSPVMQGLSGREPVWGEVKLSTESAAFLRETLSNNMRSAMSIENIGRAVKVVGESREGLIDGEGAAQLEKIIVDYKANWSDKAFFDFNKLERIATYAVQGKELPLCSINGEKASLAGFYDAVATKVSGAVDGTELRYGWMNERFGYRAKEAVEILDVVGEQTLRSEGPVAELREKFPGKQIVIEYTARDGAHEQFIYCVKDGTELVGRFAQGSDGALAKYTPYYSPVFEATIGSEGEVNIVIPDSVKAYRAPIQYSYGVGDKIDFPFSDRDVEEAHEEGEEFKTRSKLLEGTITGFTAGGDYTVSYTNPAGEAKEETVGLRTIRKANNPHWFEPSMDYFSDVNINVETDAELKSFLDKADPIIARYLPPGKTSTMNAVELAKAQKACIKALMAYTNDAMIYPRSKDSNPDAEATRYHELVDGFGRFSLGELLKIERGVCRHQCILEHLLLQKAGIDSRLASGAANTSGNDFRGFHIWCEVTLADGERFLSDQTWNDAVIPLWAGAYSVDKRRVEMDFRTARYSRNLNM